MKVLMLFSLLIVALSFGAVSSVWAEAKKETSTSHNTPEYYKMLTLDKMEADWLYEINIDFIENGFAEYYKTGNKDYIDNRLESKGYKSLITEIDNRYIWRGKHIHTLARICSQTNHIRSDLWCVYQKEYNGKVYEYWLLKMHVVYRKYPYRYCEFIVTEANSQKEKRSILNKTWTFFKEYKIDDKFSVVFPEDELEEVMLAHNFISCPRCCNTLTW